MTYPVIGDPSIALDGLSDVSLTSPGDGDRLGHDGSKWVEVPPGWEEVETKVIAADSTTLSFTGLSGDTDEVYALLFEIQNTKGSQTRIDLQFNGDTTGTNYNTQRHFAGSSNHGATNESAWVMTYVRPTDGYSSGLQWIHAKSSENAVSRHPTGAVQQIDLDGASMQFVRHHVQVWETSGTEITQIDVVSSVSGGIGDGSRVSLYKVRRAAA